MYPGFPFIDFAMPTMAHVFPEPFLIDATTNFSI
jgi:hypothetical protein